MRALPLAAIAFLGGCGDHRQPPAPASGANRSLLLVTFDTTRADHLGCYGMQDAVTPTVDRLAAQGVRYTQAWATAPITLSSHTTILTGVFPCAHGVRENGVFVVAPAARLLSEALKEAGFKTGAFVGSFVLDPKFGLNQGFDVYDAPDNTRIGAKWGVTDRPADQVSGAALRFIDGLGPGDRFFLWVHFYDPHFPHAPPADLAQGAASPYDAEITACDRELGRILDSLRAKGLDRELLVAVTADHGESLGEHGEKTHGTFCYDATLRVPLIVAPPPVGTIGGTVLDTPVSNADLAATLLDRLGVGRESLPDAKTPPLPACAADGESGDAADRPLYFESWTPYYDHRQHPLRGLIWNGMKYVETRRPELYSLRDDPGELHDRIGAQPEIAQKLAERLAAFVSDHPPLRWGAERSAMPPEDLKKMLELGYGVARTEAEPLPAALARLPDPKDRLGDQELIDQLVALVRDGSAQLAERSAAGQRLGQETLAKARSVLEQLRAGNPDDPYIDTLLPTIQMGLGDYAAAAKVLERVVSANAQNPMNRLNLGQAYFHSGHPDWAKREMEKAAAIDPSSLLVMQWLADTEQPRQHWPAAAWWLDRLLELPGQPEAVRSGWKKRRDDVQRELDKTKAAPAAPEPIPADGWAPEGLRQK